MTRSRWVAGVVFVLLAAGPSVAGAQPITEAYALYGRADFAGAIEVLERALAADGMEGTEVAEALELLALAQRGSGRDAAADQSLRVLAQVAPDHRFHGEAPPALIEQHRSLAASLEPVGVRATASREQRAVVVSVTVDGDAGAMFRGPRVHARIEGAAWQTADGDALRIDATDGVRVEYWAELVGPGGAAVATDGTAAEPRVSLPDLLDGSGEDESSDGPPWLWIGIGTGAVAAAVVVIALLAGGSSDTTSVAGPGVDF